ncbi:DNA damage checkpoint protein LCD1 [Candida viswanathii]|uniref:DNA damage checkpoint protein LCD1 n=1 Tax=Candida viswanathii TaxID=5486 RepID=A0A367XQF8_9ASCO|nr:DNA damage checkpoint protein LCD1 [Candida viswanathii]
MPNSDSDFDDDDDALLQDVLYGRTQLPVFTQTQAQTKPVQTTTTQSSAPSILDDKVQARLFQADGEIATLRAQLLQLQNQRQKEVAELTNSLNAARQSSEDQVVLLKTAVQRLEDEKRFLNNELMATNDFKRRKTAHGKFMTPHQSVQEGNNVKMVQEPVQVEPNKEVVMEPVVPIVIAKPIQKIVQLQNDSSLLVDQLWNHCIIGSKRTSFEYLSKIRLDLDLELSSGLKILKRTAIMSSIVEFLMMNKNSTLDRLVESFTLSLMELIEKLLKLKNILSVPFLVSLIHCSITFRPAAVKERLLTELVRRLSKMAQGWAFLLDSNLDEDDLANYHEVPYQVMVLEKFIFVSCLDLIERLVAVSSISKPEVIRSLWQKDTLSQALIKSCLPENSERFKNTAQINVVFNIVEMLAASVTEDTFAFNDTRLDESIISSLLKVFLIDIPLRQDFMFYGLNRILGNNSDFLKIDSVIPVDHDHLNNYLVLLPQPVPFNIATPAQFRVSMNHEYHLFTLRVRVAQLLLGLIVTKETFDFLYNREHFKSMIRVIGFEQNYIARYPRSKHIHLRIQLIGILVRIIDYLTQDLRETNELIYGEQMYEMFVVFLRIAFGADSLSIKAHELLAKIRNQPRFVELPVFNKWCETRARELNHISPHTNSGDTIASVESDYANGLEFPYESETVELARDILNRFVDHDEAENLYFNMNPDYGSDQEMEFV